MPRPPCKTRLAPHANSSPPVQDTPRPRAVHTVRRGSAAVRTCTAVGGTRRSGRHTAADSFGQEALPGIQSRAAAGRGYAAGLLAHRPAVLPRARVEWCGLILPGRPSRAGRVNDTCCPRYGAASRPRVREAEFSSLWQNSYCSEASWSVEEFTNKSSEMSTLLNDTTFFLSHSREQN